MALTNGCFREGQRDRGREKGTGDKGWRDIRSRFRGEWKGRGERAELKRREIIQGHRRTVGKWKEEKNGKDGDR